MSTFIIEGNPLRKVKKRDLKEMESDLEICVSCHSLTDVRKDTPVQEREYYIEGAGQLCEKCYNKIY